MTENISKIKEISKNVLESGKVDLIVGFRKGTMPMMSEPCSITKSDQVDLLHWDSFCGANLAAYISDRKEKVGIIAKGCDSRNVVTHIIENKIKRENVLIIGVPCQGMIDKRKIEAAVTAPIVSVEEDGDQVRVKTTDGEKTFSKADVLQENCGVCTHRNPVLYDELAGDKVPEQSIEDRFPQVNHIEGLSTEERNAHFSNLVSSCIRCYACRNACPLCYCPTCFVDESKPQWVGKTLNSTDVETFHFLRAYHCAGRCTDCGACERACPMDIKIRDFTKKLNKDCLELFGWEAGLTIEERPPLDTYKLNDPDEFIK